MKTKLAFLLSLMFGITFQLSAQYDLLYENHQPGLGIIPRAVADDGQGNTWLAGNFGASLTLGTITLPSTNNSPQFLFFSTGFVGKFNSGSNTWLWAKKITLISNGSGYQTYPNFSEIWDMATDNAGNSYITGWYSGVISFDNISLSSTKQGKKHTADIFVAKYNTNGAIVWAKSFGSKEGTDRSNTIALDGSGNIFIGGIFTNTYLNNNICGTSDGGKDIYDVYLVKLNNAGTAQWQKRYASSSINCATYNEGYDLSVDASGNVCMVGQFSGTVSFGTGSALTISSVNGSVDAFAAKINGSGTTQWVKTIGGNTTDTGTSIYADASGNVYVGGKMPPDAYLTKYNSSGNLIWSVNPYPASLAIPSNSVNKINPYSSSIVVNDGFVGFKIISPANGFVMASDSLIGNTSPGTSYHIMDTEIAGSGFVFAVMGRCGEVTVGGTALTSASSCNFGSDDNFFLVRNDSEGPPPAFNQDHGINNFLETSPKFAVNEFDVYPNPAKNEFHLRLPKSDFNTTVHIYDHLGRIAWTEKIEKNTSTLIIELNDNLENGIYYIHVQQSDQYYTRQLIIAK